ncbi:hypothetical protein QYF36_010715 [Acer negundo]|nr:hypothetical protein QYF36_010715 [Acer negundo]
MFGLRTELSQNPRKSVIVLFALRTAAVKVEQICKGVGKGKSLAGDFILMWKVENLFQCLSLGPLKLQLPTISFPLDSIKMQLPPTALKFKFDRDNLAVLCRICSSGSFQPQADDMNP